jgi:hypothetical protein
VTQGHDQAIRPEQPPARSLPGWAIVLLAYLLSRVVVAAATATVAALSLSGARCGDAIPRPIEGFAALSRCWDTIWFLRVALQGYPAVPPAGFGQSTLAFFPGYPGLIAVLHAAGVSPLVAALTVSLVAGAAATLLVWRLGLCVASPPAAVRAAILFTVFPGAAVLSWGYSEALAAACAGAALLFLYQRQWLLAGVAAGLAGTTRADVWLAVSVAAAVAAAVALRRDREWRALLAPVLAPMGGLAFLGYVWWRTGSPRTWFLTQSRGWDQHMDWGTHAVNTLARLLTGPFASPTRAIQLLAVLLLVGGLAALVRAPVPAPWLAFVVVLLLISLTSSQVGFRLRAELLLLPAFVAAGSWLRAPAVAWLVPILATCQVLVVVLWLGAPLIAPP